MGLAANANKKFDSQRIPSIQSVESQPITITHNKGKIKRYKRIKNHDNLKVIYNKLIEHDIKNPKIVMAQIIKESTYLTSGYVTKHNNICGFDFKRKPIHFRSIDHCINYMKRWQKKTLKKTCVYNPEKNYYNFLDTLWVWKGDVVRYAKDPDYTDGLKKLEPTVENLINAY